MSTLKLLSPLPAAAIVEPPKPPPPSPQHRQVSRQGWRWQRREAPARPPPLPPRRRRRRRQIRELPEGKTSPAELQLSATPPPSQPGAHNCTGVWIPLGFFSTASYLAPPLLLRFLFCNSGIPFCHHLISAWGPQKFIAKSDHSPFLRELSKRHSESRALCELHLLPRDPSVSPLPTSHLSLVTTWCLLCQLCLCKCWSLCLGMGYL